MKIKIEIKNRWTGRVIFEFETENNTMAKTIAEYVRLATKENLRTNLTDADLTDANLTRADLTRADLTGADLTDADLTDADLTDANLTDANLTRADLTDANLTDANLTRANLTDANLTRIKYDFFGRLLMQKHEANALRDKLVAGEVDGSCYEGNCCCFVGTIANAANQHYELLPMLKPDSGSATERWFMGISQGHTPENSVVVRQTIAWIDEFIELVK